MEPKPHEHHKSPIFPLKFELFIEAVGMGASRSRGIMSLLLTATFISALSCYNALESKYNWLSSRLNALQLASEWVLFSDEKPHPNKIAISPNSKDSLDNAFDLNELKKLFAQNPNLQIDSINALPNHLKVRIPIYYLNKNSTINLEKIPAHDFQIAVFTISQMAVTNRMELLNQLQIFGRARVENSILIKMPILGISFDVNGLLVISAAAFCILFFLLYHSLSRERKNLTLIFKLGDYYEIEDVYLYQLLSMQQVLTVPSSIDEYIKSNEEGRLIKPSWFDWFSNRAFRILTVIPILAPIAIWIIIWRYDDYTRNVGVAINPELTSINFRIANLLGIFMIIMACICVTQWWEINQTWRRESKDIKRKLLANVPQPEKRKK